MSSYLQKAASLLNIIYRSKHADCVNFFENLNDKGIELICKLIYYIVSGEITLHPTSHARLKRKIKKHITDIKRLFLIPRNSQDISKKKKILQQKKIVSILTSIANAAIPIIDQILAKKTS